MFTIEADDKSMDVAYTKTIGMLKLSNVYYSGMLRIVSANILQGTLEPVNENPDRFLVGNNGANLFFQ
ncbi:MAG: hypothetical protein IPN36_05800 [Bacteroidetes bacterium]|nr:hypothetical protein [Bacteroidota bacterium]